MCAGNIDNQAEGGRLGLLKDLQGALRSHPGSAGVVKEACGAVWIMCHNNSDNRAEGGRLGLLQDLQGALCSHPGSAGVVESAFIEAMIRMFY